MSLKKYTIQNILLPSQGPQGVEWKLYYQGAENICETLEDGGSRILLSHYKDYNFCSYFNSLSIEKWLKYTNIRRLFLKLEMEGDFEVTIDGYHLVAESVQRKTYSKKRYRFEHRDILKMEIPTDTDEMMMGFSIKAYSDSSFYGGSYEAEIEEKDIRDIHISIATTTFKKEPYIKKNVDMVKRELMSDPEMNGHWSMHVVDNGRTLERGEIEGEGVYYHANKNVGGAGGFARGMMETLNSADSATHILLMDDDVVILPESLKRTYYLLAMAKEKYQGHIISGAMLNLERMSWFHEDAGYFADGVHHPIKEPANMGNIKKVLITENVPTEVNYGYAAWWYCCMPIELVREKGLPLPLFIRGDDVEYGIRGQVHIITMNGICLWHMGFTSKYNAALNYYQSFRNAMIMNACDGCGKESEIIGHYTRRFHEELERFNYNAAQLILLGWRDYMKGPKFVEIDQGEKIMKRNSALNAKMRNIEEFKVSVNPMDMYEETPINSIAFVLYKLIKNGHRLCSTRWLNEEPVAVAYDEFFDPPRQMFRKNLIAVNIYNMTAEEHSLDRSRYQELRAQYRKLKKQYMKNKDRLEQAYRQRQPYLVSEEFWNQYLEIEKYQ